jgi:Tol biopolymer transport system component
LATNDLNAAADVFLFDRVTGKTTLISAAGDGSPGAGTSLGSGMSGDARRIAFVSRASNLTRPDTNGTWDVFVRDVPAGRTVLASVASEGGNSTGSASEAVISADARYVIFRSAARDLAPSAFLSGHNLYRRDLMTGRTECVTTNLPTALQTTWRMTAWTATPDAGVLVLAATAVSAQAVSNLVSWHNLVTGESVNCSSPWPAEYPPRTVRSMSVPAVSADGRFVTFRAEWTWPGSTRRQALCLHDVAQNTTTFLSLRTNSIQRDPFPPSAFCASLDGNGRYVAYSAPLPTYDASSGVLTNGVSQVYLRDVQTQTTRLVSAAADGVTPANADASDARLTPDGLVVFFVSRATNLSPDAPTEANRLYGWNRETGSLQVVAALSDSDPSGQFVVSPNGAWVAALGRERDVPAVFYLNTVEGALTHEPFPLAVEQSSTGRGWIGVQSTGVSADGRYVTLTAFPPGPLGDTNHMQVYLLDTRTGSRQLMTQGSDGRLPFFHGALPVLSPDGAKLLFASAATNLVTADLNGRADVFLHTVATGERTILRGASLSADAEPYTVGPISPDGRVAFVSFREGVNTNSRLTSLTSGQSSAALPGLALAPPSFSQTGQKIAVSLSTNRAGGSFPKVAVFDADAWINGGDNPPAALWVSSADAREPVLSADGSRVAYFYIAAAGTNAVVVTDWARGQFVFTNNLGRLTPSSLGLSADGRFVSWISPSSTTGVVNQVWRADVDSGTVDLVSVGADGVREADGNCRVAAISPDGRFVAFASLAGNLVPDDPNNAKDVFFRDMAERRTLLLSRTPSGTAGGGWSLRPFFSADGRSLFFVSHAPDLAAGDYNQAVDLFQVELIAASDLLVLIRRDLSSGHASLLWQGAPNTTCQIQFKTDLRDGDWSTFPGAFTGNGEVNIDTAPDTQRFYRLVEGNGVRH